MTESWYASPRQRIAALAETERRVSAENVALFQALTELRRRVERVRRECELRECDTFPRMILNILDGEKGTT